VATPPPAADRRRGKAAQQAGGPGGGPQRSGETSGSPSPGCPCDRLGSDPSRSLRRELASPRSGAPVLLPPEGDPAAPPVGDRRNLLLRIGDRESDLRKRSLPPGRGSFPPRRSAPWPPAPGDGNRRRQWPEVPDDGNHPPPDAVHRDSTRRGDPCAAPRGGRRSAQGGDGRVGSQGYGSWRCGSVGALDSSR
jgi:hypothetical protein